jgi:hypothetical protein
VERRVAHTSIVRASVVALLCVAAALALAAQARAQTVEPLTLARLTPPDRAALPLTPTGGIPWQITVAGPPPGANVSVTVSTSLTTGSDGATLATTDRVDLFFLSEDEGTPSVYSGRSDPGPNAWSATAGTYFWQAVATWTDAGGVLHSAASPIQRLFVGTPPTAPNPSPVPSTGVRTILRMSSLDVKFYLRAAIRQRTRRTPSRLHYRCVRRTSRSFRCRPTWRDRRNVYSATTATFTHTRTNGRIVARATITGRRATRSCARRRSVRSCGRRFRWHTVTAGRVPGR